MHQLRFLNPHSFISHWSRLLEIYFFCTCRCSKRPSGWHFKHGLECNHWQRWQSKARKTCCNLLTSSANIWYSANIHWSANPEYLTSSANIWSRANIQRSSIPNILPVAQISTDDPANIQSVSQMSTDQPYLTFWVTYCPDWDHMFFYWLRLWQSILRAKNT